MSWAPPEFLIRAALAGVGAAFAAGPLGCFVLWRRMAYFGDATAHAAILGVALALASETPVFLGVLASALAMAVWVSAASGRTYAMDAMLGVSAHAALAFGLIALSFLPDVRIDLMGYLFGDILAVGWRDVATIWAGAALAAGLLAWRWRDLITSTLSADLAAAEGCDPRAAQMILTIALALLVAVALKVVGALLITALLIIPAAAARAVARTPGAMAVAAVAAATVAALAGLGASWRLDTPAGPSIVAAAVGLLALATGVSALARRG
ncbi:MAG: metal ABC transporter permease [Rubrimonas sp.]|uniref:metal ABC transporter permease n=1 Tax=Rubrimonas sp. TaxID=2036015 RepID=UPI002FDCABD2